VRSHRDLITRYESFNIDDDPELVVVSFGTPSRVVKSAVIKAREKGMKVGALRLISLWPFPDELFRNKTKYLSVELNYDGQLVREIQRACPKDSEVHFLGQCGELPTIQDLLEVFQGFIEGKPVSSAEWQREVW
jgi:2-oxoglutarate ferredoxin oxidoreductase subunit alpha